MPTYAYACTVCGHRFDVVQSFSEDALSVCPECEGRLRKVFNTVGVVFKGSGFYRTDSRNTQAKDGEKAVSAEKSGSSDASGSAGSSGSAAGSKDGSAAKVGSSSTGSSSSAPAAAAS